MPPFRGRRGTTASLVKANKLGIRTSKVSRWSRSHSFNYAVRASAVLIAVIIGNALISFAIILSQIDFRGTYTPYTRAVGGGANDEPSIEDLCSSRGKHKWRGDIDHYIGSTASDVPSFAIVLTVNDGYYDFFVNWHAYFNEAVAKKKKPDRPLLIIIAEDSTIHTKLRSMSQLNQESTIVLPGYKAAATDKAEDYDSEAYKSLVSSRATHLLNLICSLEGQSDNISDESGTEDESNSKREEIIIVYADVDTVWRQDPLPYFRKEMFGSHNNATQTQQRYNYDILAQVDDHDYMDIDTYYCTGLLVLAQTPATLAFLSRWEKELLSSPQLNQPIFNTLLRSEELPKIRHGGLGEIEFPPGRLYFDEWVTEGGEAEKRKKKETIVVHNNYIIGHDAKKQRFQDHDLWKDNAPKE